MTANDLIAAQLDAPELYDLYLWCWSYAQQKRSNPVSITDDEIAQAKFCSIVQVQKVKQRLAEIGVIEILPTGIRVAEYSTPLTEGDVEKFYGTTLKNDTKNYAKDADKVVIDFTKETDNDDRHVSATANGSNIPYKKLLPRRVLDCKKHGKVNKSGRRRKPRQDLHLD